MGLLLRSLLSCCCGELAGKEKMPEENELDHLDLQATENIALKPATHLPLWLRVVLYVLAYVAVPILASFLTYWAAVQGKVQQQVKAELQPMGNPAPPQPKPEALLKTVATPSSSGELGRTPQAILLPGKGHLILTGSAQGFSDGASYRSSLQVSLFVNNDDCSSDLSYVPNNWRISHLVTAACIVAVDGKRPIILQVTPVAIDIPDDKIIVTGNYLFVKD